MTLKDLRILLEREERQQLKLQRQLSTTELTPEVILLLNKYKDRRFWCGHLEDPNPKTPCFNHAISLPYKWNKPQPLHDYQVDLIDLLEGMNQGGNNPDNSIKKYIWIKKSIGIGISELMLRYVAWLGICQNEKYRYSKLFLTCGPREKTAIELISRLKDH